MFIKRKEETETGFSLVEIMVAVGIIAVLAAITLPLMVSAQAQQAKADLRKNVSNTTTSIQNFLIMHPNASESEIANSLGTVLAENTTLTITGEKGAYVVCGTNGKYGWTYDSTTTAYSENTANTCDTGTFVRTVSEAPVVSGAIQNAAETIAPETFVSGFIPPAVCNAHFTELYELGWNSGHEDYRGKKQHHTFEVIEQSHGKGYDIVCDPIVEQAYEDGHNGKQACDNDYEDSNTSYREGNQAIETSRNNSSENRNDNSYDYDTSKGKKK